MYYNSDDLQPFDGDRVVQMADFLVDGWGYIRKKDLLTLFNLNKLNYTNCLKYIKKQQLKPIEEKDFVAVEFFPGYVPTEKFLNAITVLTTLKQKNRNHSVIITDNTHSNLFVAKMYIKNPKTDELRTYYVLDSKFISVPFYVLQELIQSELDNGYSKHNRLVIIVYPDTNVEYIDLDIPIYFALLQVQKNATYIEFYDNKKMQK